MLPSDVVIRYLHWPRIEVIYALAFICYYSIAQLMLVFSSTRTHISIVDIKCLKARVARKLGFLQKIGNKSVDSNIGVISKVIE